MVCVPLEEGGKTWEEGKEGLKGGNVGGRKEGLREGGGSMGGRKEGLRGWDKQQVGLRKLF